MFGRKVALMFYLPLLLTVISRVKGQGQNKSDGALYVADVCGTLFDGVRDMKEPPRIEQAVWHIEEDKTTKGSYILADGSALKMYGDTVGVVQPTHTIAGMSLNHSYNEGFYTEARFNFITGFSQLNLTHIVLVDSNNHCIRIVNRETNETSTYAGICETAGHANGIENATFRNPYQIALNGESLYVTDQGNNAIRQISIITGEVSTYETLSQPPIAITTDARYLFFTTTTEFSRIKLATGKLIPVIPSNTAGFQDGALLSAMINRVHGIRLVGLNMIYLADTGNNRIRILNRKSRNISSVCNGNHGMLSGDIENCEVIQPLSFFTLMSGDTFVGTNTSEARVITYTEEINSASVIDNNTLPAAVPANITTVGISHDPSPPPAAANGMAIMGAVIAVVVLAAATIVIVSFVVHRRKLRRNKEARANLEKYVEQNIRNQSIKPKDGLEKTESYSYAYNEYEEAEDPYQTFEDIDLEGYTVVREEYGEENLKHPPARYGALPKRPSVTDAAENYYCATELTTNQIKDEEKDSLPLPPASPHPQAKENFDYIGFETSSSSHYKI